MAATMQSEKTSTIDPRSGFCKATSIFHSKRRPISLPPNHFLDAATFISSLPHHSTTAFVDTSTGRSLTFTQLWLSVDAVSSSLSELGVRKGDVVLLLSHNSIFFPVVCLAVLSIGAVVTTANPLNTPRDIANQISDSKPVLVFTLTHLLPKLAASALPIVLLDHGSSSRNSETRVVCTLEEMMKKKPSERRVKERVNQTDAAMILYSSGTTGASKGVVSSHQNIIAFVQTSSNRFKLADGKPPKFLCTIPMFHVYGLAAFALGSVASGSTTVLISKFDLHDVLAAIEKHRVTYLPLVPPILVTMVNEADRIRRRYDLSSLESVLCGGAPLGKEVVEGFVEKYPTVRVEMGYSLTEAMGGGAWTKSMEESRKHGAAGLLSPSTEAKIVDPESGEALGVNCSGELWLRGPNTMKGYLNHPEATAKTIDSEGWLRTGDLCYIDDDGFLFVIDRLKDIIKYKAYQVAPAELEALLLTHPEISDAAVISFPDKDVGQYPMAYVVRKAESDLSGKAIMNFVAKQVAPYKKIRRVAFISSIPKTPAGKILKKDLAKLATSKL